MSSTQCGLDNYANIPNEMEIEILRILDGEDVPGWTWGAAMAICCENLVSMGLANNGYSITEKGREFLNVHRLGKQTNVHN